MGRVVISGLGPVSSIGIGVEDFTDSLLAGRSGIGPITSFDTTGFPHTRAGEVQGFDPAAILQRLNPQEWGRSTLFAAAAARLAVADAALDLNGVDSERVGVVIGTTCGESQTIERIATAALRSGFSEVPPDLIRQSPGERLSYGVSEELQVSGESITLSTACAASNYAIGYAFDRLAAGEADVMVAGGADSVCRWVHAGFYRLGSLAKEACTPFDGNRGGLLTAEGGSALLLETMEHARKRGARIYAEVLGYATNCDADHIVAPNAASIAECIRLAHCRASVARSDISYICAHGTGTQANDSAEAEAVRLVFGTAMPPMSSIKSMLGHTMGAASGFGAIASALAIQNGFLPPTINWSTPDPTMQDLDPVPNRARKARVEVVQNNGFAFGGNNAITILGACA